MASGTGRICALLLLVILTSLCLGPPAPRPGTTPASDVTEALPVVVEVPSRSGMVTPDVHVVDVAGGSPGDTHPVVDTSMAVATPENRTMVDSSAPRSNATDAYAVESSAG